MSTTSESTHANPFKKRLWAGMVAIVAITGLGYAWFSYRFPTWVETVALPDGRTIDVKERRDFIEGRGTRRTWLTFSLPEMGGERTWSEYLYPTMIGAANGTAYVIGRPWGGAQFQRYSHPRYVYVAFRWRDGKFERVPFLSVPENLRTEENIRWCMPGGDDSKVASHNARDWCVERSGPSDKYPTPRLVDLRTRAAEAEFWARIEGHQPDSE